MKTKVRNLLAIVASTVAAASLFAVDSLPVTASTEADARFAGVRQTMAALTLAEVPDQAASFVLHTDDAQRSQMVRAVLEGALTKYPSATFATVKAVLKVAPDQVKPIMESVFAVAPKQLNTALRAVLENDRASVDVALQVIGEVAPAQLSSAQAIVLRETNTGRLRRASPPPLFAGTPVVVQQTTVAATAPPKRHPNDYPVGP
jgi:hypothetical protein